MARPLPLARRLAFSAFTFGFFLLVLEGALAALPRALLWGRGGPATAAATTILCVGDSVTAGDGLTASQAWPAQLGQALRQRGLGTVSVQNAARPGADSRVLEAFGTFYAVPAGSRPVVLVMVGHNDFLFWESLSRRDELFGQPGADRRPPPRATEGPRLLRVLRWGLGAARGAVPTVHIDPEERGVYLARLQKMKASVRQQSGSLYLLTYPLPGAPPPGVDPRLAEVLHNAHHGQREINQAIREVASEADVPLIDVERQLRLPAEWSQEDFLDHIHLTARSGTAVADLVRETLVLAGELPPDAL